MSSDGQKNRPKRPRYDRVERTAIDRRSDRNAINKKIRNRPEIGNSDQRPLHPSDFSDFFPDSN